jgi:hypothetical protein
LVIRRGYVRHQLAERHGFRPRAWPARLQLTIFRERRNAWHIPPQKIPSNASSTENSRVRSARVPPR